MVTFGFIMTSAVSQKPRKISVMKSISADRSRISEKEVLLLFSCARTRSEKGQNGGITLVAVCQNAALRKGLLFRACANGGGG